VIPLLLALAQLSGEYLQDCRAGGIRSEAFSGDLVVFTERYHREVACLNLNVTIRSYGSYLVGAEVAEPAGASEIDFRFLKVTVSPAGGEIAADYRARRVCGSGDWKEGGETEVTGLSCEFTPGFPLRVPAAGEARFGIVKVGEGWLQMGAISPGRDAMAPDRRPLALDPLPYKRKN